MEKPTLVFGFPDEWKKFESTHPKFFQSFPNLKACVTASLFRTFDWPERADKIVFLLGRLCVEDFMEALILCGNGYGNGALKIVRGMFERVVTAHYIHEHPEEAEKFLNYYWIQQHKIVVAIRETLGDDVLDPATIEVINNNYDIFKGEYQVTNCKKCGTARTNHIWSKFDTVAMAKKVGLGEMVVSCYYETLKHVHSNVIAASSRFVKRGDEGYVFDWGPQSHVASNTLHLVHMLLLKVLGLQIEHFELSSLKEKFEICAQDYRESWSAR